MVEGNKCLLEIEGTSTILQHTESAVAVAKSNHESFKWW